MFCTHLCRNRGSVSVPTQRIRVRTDPPYLSRSREIVRIRADSDPLSQHVYQFGTYRPYSALFGNTFYWEDLHFLDISLPMTCTGPVQKMDPLTNVQVIQQCQVSYCSGDRSVVSHCLGDGTMPSFLFFM